MKKAIIVFLDILGYTDVVLSDPKNDQRAISIKKAIENGMQRTYEKLESTLLRWDQHINTNDKLRASEIFLDFFKHKIPVRFISDSIILTVILDQFEKEHNREMFNMFMFLLKFGISYLSSQIFTNLFINTQHLLRGGIAIGSNFEEELTTGHGTFVYSESLIKAFHLEKNTTYPRILIGNDVLKYFSENSTSRVNFYSYKHSNENNYLDIYRYLDYNREEFSLCREIIISQIDILNSGIHTIDNRELKKRIRKWIYFKNYHNRFCKNRKTLNDLII